MDFSGPDQADFANVAALNRAFLDQLRSRSNGRTLRSGIPVSLHDATLGLGTRQVGRLSLAPFLLFSLREHDVATWDRLCADGTSADLLTPPRDSSMDLVTAAVSFIWHLARRNPYAARLVCGAAPEWCERISDHTLFGLLQRVSACPHILQPRFAGNAGCWQKLLGPGLSSNAGVRESAYLACLQTLLTETAFETPPRLRTAACNTSTPVLSLSKRKRLT